MHTLTLLSQPHSTHQLAQNMNQLLRELVDLVGVPHQQEVTPILELQFNKIVTLASVRDEEASAALVVTALLPVQDTDNAQYLFSTMQLQQSYLPECELVWHTDKRQFVAMKQIPVNDLPDEISVLDAMMDVSDQAQSWLKTLQSH